MSLVKCHVSFSTDKMQLGIQAELVRETCYFSWVLMLLTCLISFVLVNLR